MQCGDITPNFPVKQEFHQNQDFVEIILTEIQMMDIRKIPNLKMTNDKAQMSNQAQNSNDQNKTKLQDET